MVFFKGYSLNFVAKVDPALICYFSKAIALIFRWKLTLHFVVFVKYYSLNFLSKLTLHFVVFFKVYSLNFVAKVDPAFFGIFQRL